MNPSTISVVLNDTPGRSIPDETRRRIKEAAKEFNYQPNLLARSFRSRRTLTLGILVPELGDGYHTAVMTGVGDYLVEAGYFYFTAHHRHRPNLVEQYSKQLVAKGAEGLICIDTALEHSLSVPVVAVAGHRHIEGVTNVVLDHRRAAELTLTHLYSLGHRRIAFMRGQPFSSDSDDRWRGIVEVGKELGIEIRSELTVQLNRDISSPELGYPVVQQLFDGKRNFTALVCFNDIAAIGAIRAIHDLGLLVPNDISVIGFDDIKAAAYISPNLTTIRQPLSEMGRLAAQCIVNRLNRTESFREQVAFEPELVIRESTCSVKPQTQFSGAGVTGSSRKSRNGSLVKK
ncbi:MAG TPA: LacI family DNA-binding transcriptional regulator [Alloacidobacterium sp.]|nr:LacI family DNA-binding transcriptional regulator [Alloacidobacterium sp.]